MLTDLQNPFTCRLCGAFVVNWSLKISAILNHVATLPCEISVHKNPMLQK